MITISRNRLPLIVAILLLSVTGIWYWSGKSESKQDRYKIQVVDRGDIVQSISANGTLNPVELVNVGTQVSGTVSKIYVDFNDQIEEGQVLAELDPALFRAQLQQAEANVMNAQASLKLAENKMARNLALKEQGFISSDGLNMFEQQLDAARAQLALSKAQLARDRANFYYSVIKSPISGVVVARNVEIGQTVAAVFQTPVLFQIAKDLRQMQIDTSVAEADIGQLRLGQQANFTVDAFHEREFSGTVKQVRLNPSIQQNVVTYNVVVTVANEDGALLPGMTANVRFAVNQKDSVLRAPNAALRYKPSDADTDGAPTRQPSKSVLYRLEGGKPVPVNVKTGIADGAFTEITEGGIKEGDKLVVREAANKDKSGSNFKLRMF
ncbi:MAG: efflux RND transporter periplasmic adaptor subunit [Nitrosospira sp.]|nr:efflux RND transporter periplasmic adaptor subunit [Nitrosospira sp.]MBI0412867.1 efflux RND transporter periplasmic adaptor subunit [Nitrosospira sp.]